MLEFNQVAIALGFHKGDLIVVGVACRSKAVMWGALTFLLLFWPLDNLLKLLGEGHYNCGILVP